MSSVHGRVALVTGAGRGIGRAIAVVAAFLCSDAAAGITGQAWNVDGGAVPS